MFMISLLLLGPLIANQTWHAIPGCVDRTVGIKPADVCVTAEFCERIAAYVTRRGELQESLPGQRITDDVAEIRSVVRALAAKIRSAPGKPKEGEIFTATTAAVLRRRL